jgi:large conductance mechanosensitive channel
MLEEFRQFINRGNVIDLALAVIIGGAFGAIVSSLIDDIIMPLIGLLLGGVSFVELAIQVGDAVIAYGHFIQAVVNFFVISVAVFLAVRSYNKLQERKEQEPDAPPEPSAEERLLAEIRDLLREQA